MPPLEPLSPAGPESGSTRSPVPSSLPLPVASKPGARHCSATTRHGTACRAWAVRDTDPPLCSTHASRNTGAGAPPRNQNGTTHGFYSLLYTPEEAAELADMSRCTSLDPEIGCVRIAIRRVLRLLTDPSEDPSPLEVIRLVHLVLSGARTLARLMRDQAILNPGSDELSASIGQALDEIGGQLGIDLMGEMAPLQEGLDDQEYFTTE